MFEDRSLKLDLCALALSALVVFLGVALWTYEATDPPGTLVWPPNEGVVRSTSACCAQSAGSFRS
jgi:hypothetical protein